METDIDTSKKKNDLTLDMIMRVVKLSKLQIRSIFTGVLQRNRAPDNEQILAPEDVFYLLLADMLENLSFLSSEQRLLICELIYDTRSELELPCSSCIAQIAFADGRYVTWTGASGWIALESGDRVEQLPRTPLETIAYNLRELHRRGVQLIENRAGLNVKNDNTGSVEKPGDVRERTADAVSG